MCCTAAIAWGPANRISPMWLTSKMPTPVRTAMCSATMPHPIDAGYSTGMSQPLNSTIFAPIWRWTGFNAVLRTFFGTTDGVASTTDKKNLGYKVAGRPELELIKLTSGHERRQIKGRCQVSGDRSQENQIGKSELVPEARGCS